MDRASFTAAPSGPSTKHERMNEESRRTQLLPAAHMQAAMIGTWVVLDIWEKTV